MATGAAAAAAGVAVGALHFTECAWHCRYGMLDPSLKDKEGLPLTIRAVFIIGMPLQISFLWRLHVLSDGSVLQA